MPTPKVWQINDLPLMWGYAGPEIYGELLRPQIGSAHPETWSALEEQLRAASAAVNRRARTEMAEAGTPGVLAERELVWTVIAGFIGGAGQILETNTYGGAGLSPVPFTYLGSGRDDAFFASDILARLGREPDIVALRAVMEAVVRRQPSTLAEPIEYWRITPERVEPVTAP